MIMMMIMMMIIMIMIMIRNELRSTRGQSVELTDFVEAWCE